MIWFNSTVTNNDNLLGALSWYIQSGYPDKHIRRFIEGVENQPDSWRRREDYSGFVHMMTGGMLGPEDVDRWARSEDEAIKAGNNKGILF